MTSENRLRFSASRMSTFMTCPLQAKFKYIDMLPTKMSAAATFGTCIHHALNTYNQTANIDLSLQEFLQVWDDPAKLNAEPDSWPKGTSYGSYRDRGLGMLRAYHDACKWDKREVLATEHEFVVPFGDFELHGFVDLVEIRKDNKGKRELRIIDYKTNRKKPSIFALSQNVQFTTYYYASLQKEFWFGVPEYNTPHIRNARDNWDYWKDRKPQAIWYHLETNQEVKAGRRDDKDFMRLYRACLEISKAISSDTFVPNISGDSCVQCPYTEPCGVSFSNVQSDNEGEEFSPWLFK